MNIELFKRVLAHIESDYKHFTMRYWSISKKRAVKGKPDFIPNNRLSCGTVGCLAGFTISEALGQEAFTKLSSDEMCDQARIIPNLAQKLLGLSDEEVSDLFYSQGRSHYMRAMEGKVMGTKAYAKAVADAIREYVLERRGVQL